MFRVRAGVPHWALTLAEHAIPCSLLMSTTPKETAHAAIPQSRAIQLRRVPARLGPALKILTLEDYNNSFDTISATAEWVRRR
jgi:hypothetical protein